MHRLRYISLFSGGFGLDLGMEAAGFEVVGCVEVAAAMRATIRHNRPNVTVIGDKDDEFDGDLYKIPSSLIMERAGVNPGEVDLVVGGPPCQAFSILGNRKGLDDPRGNLMLEFVRVVKDVRPKCFIMENVAGFLSLHKGAQYEQVKGAFKDAGYRYITTWKLNAVAFGVPQYRERVFIIGFREDITGIGNLKLEPPAPTHRPPVRDEQISPTQNALFDEGASKLSLEVDPRPAYRCVKHVLRNLPKNLPNHELRPHGERVAKRYALVPPGGRDRVDHTDRLHWGRPSGTVLVGSSGGGGRPFIHPEEPRHLTVREAARLQMFPDTWVFQGRQTDQYRQVGNAVPIALAEAVSRQVAEYLQQALTYGNVCDSVDQAEDDRSVEGTSLSNSHEAQSVQSKDFLLQHVHG